MDRSLFAGVHINKKRFQRDIDLFQVGFRFLAARPAALLCFARLNSAPYLPARS